MRDHALEKYRGYLKAQDLRSAEMSQTIPHYFPSIRDRTEVEFFLQNKFPVSLVTTILQVRLNRNSVYSNGKWYNLGLFTHAPCKYCGDSLSFFHLVWDCQGTRALRTKHFPHPPNPPESVLEPTSPLFNSMDFPIRLKKLITEILAKF